MNMNLHSLPAALALAIAVALPMAANVAVAAPASGTTTTNYEFRWPVAGLQAAPAKCVKHSVTYAGTVMAVAGDPGDGIQVPVTTIGSCTQVEVVVVGAGSAAPAGGSATASDMATATLPIPSPLQSWSITVYPANAFTNLGTGCAGGGECWVYSSEVYVGDADVIANGSLTARGAFSYPLPVVCATGCVGQYDQFGGVTGTTPGYVTLTFLP